MRRNNSCKPPVGSTPISQKICDPLFTPQDFFDPRDGLQVRYEMLRRHHADGQSVMVTARAFGISRQHFYHLSQAFQQRGLYGLIPQKRGPRAPNKCKAAILEYVVLRRQETPPLPWGALAQDIEQIFGLHLHPRTLERRWAAEQKKTNESSRHP